LLAFDSWGFNRVNPKNKGMISLTPGLFFNAETAEILAENAEKNSMIVFFRVFRVEKKLITIFGSKVCISLKIRWK